MMDLNYQENTGEVKNTIGNSFDVDSFDAEAFLQDLGV